MSRIIHVYMGHVPQYQGSWRLHEPEGDTTLSHRVRFVQPADNSFCVAMDDTNSCLFQNSTLEKMTGKIRTEANRDEPIYLDAQPTGTDDDGTPVLFECPPATVPCDGNWALKCAGVNIGREVSDA
jgi:hypothetical protein